MRSRRLSLVIIAVLSNTLMYSQQNFLPGEIHLSDKSTLKGFINYRNWAKNPSSIQFKNTEGGMVTRYGIRDLDGFMVYDHDTYIKADVLVDMNPLDANDMTTYSNELILRDTVFLRQLAVTRNLKLYELTNSKLHLYLQSSTLPPEELGYTMSVVRTGAVVGSDKYIQTDTRYRRQLKAALGDSLTNKQSKTIDQLPYTTKHVANFFNSLNVSNKTKNAATAALVKKKGYSLFAGGGMIYQKFGFESSYPGLSSLKFDPSFTYIVTGGIDLFSSRNFSNVTLRAELSLNEIRGEGSGYSEIQASGSDQYNEYSFKQVNITPAISVLYNFIGTTRTKIYAGITAGYNLSSYPNQTWTYKNEYGDETVADGFPVFERSWVNVLARLGVLVNKKMELGLSYEIGGSFVKYTLTSETSHPASLRFFYHFN